MKYNLDESQENELRKKWQVLSNNNYNDQELLEIFPEAIPILKQKMGFLRQQIKMGELDVLALLGRVYARTDPDTFGQWFWLEIVRTLHSEPIDALKRKLQKLKFLLSPPAVLKEGQITEQMIERAKEYPFDYLLQFNKAAFTKCFSHNENKPSLHLNKKVNKIHCFGCQKSWDTIAYVQETKGLTFPEAVKTLATQ